MINQFKLVPEGRFYFDYDGSLTYYSSLGGGPADLTGWIRNSDDVVRWFLHGKPSTVQEVFESLTDEQKEKIIWELDKWK